MLKLLNRIVAAYKINISSTTIFYSESIPPELLSEFSQLNFKTRLSNHTPSRHAFHRLPLLDIIAESYEGIKINLSTQESTIYSKRKIFAFNDEIFGQSYDYNGTIFKFFYIHLANKKQF